MIQGENGERRVLRSTPDWSEEAINADHLWSPTSASGDLCYVGETECTVLHFEKYSHVRYMAFMTANLIASNGNR